MSSTLSQPTVATYVPGGDEAWRSPWAGYAALRDLDPVHHVVPEGRPHEDFYVLTRHADVLDAAVDTATFSSAQGLTVEYGEMEKIGLADNPPLVMQDPPDHTAFRRLVSRGFTPRQVIDIEPAVRAFVVERVEQIAERGHGDIVTELFKPLPSMVVAYYLGVPARTETASTPGPTPSSRPVRAEMRPTRPTRPPRCSATSRRSSSGAGASLATTPSRTSWPPASGDDRWPDLDPRLRLRHGHRWQRHHDRRPRRRGPVACRGPGQRAALVADPLLTGSGRGVPAAHLTGAGPGPYDDPRRRTARRHDPGRPQGAAALRCREPRPAPLRSRRRRARRPPRAVPDPGASGRAGTTAWATRPPGCRCGSRSRSCSPGSRTSPWTSRRSAGRPGRTSAVRSPCRSRSTP